MCAWRSQRRYGSEDREERERGGGGEREEGKGKKEEEDSGQRRGEVTWQSEEDGYTGGSFI